jgi:hypothetical protein
MKKISILFAVLFALSTFVACEKDDVGALPQRLLQANGM